jgi:predicted dehydrogenase
VHLLILGYSSIVRRRVIPAARLLPGIRQITIASRTHGPADAQHGEADAQHGDPLIAWFGSYDQALAASGADLVYVSGVNSAHATWVMRALEGGLHVMVDKPAFLDLESARSAVALARERKRGLAEATVFPFHPQAAVVQSLIDPGEASSTRVTATLSRRSPRTTSAIGPSAVAGVSMTSVRTRLPPTGWCFAPRRHRSTARCSPEGARPTSTRPSACCLRTTTAARSSATSAS